MLQACQKRADSADAQNGESYDAHLLAEPRTDIAVLADYFNAQVEILRTSEASLDGLCILPR